MGALRLRSPRPHAPWTNPRNCSTIPPKCAQEHITRDGWSGVEDCLFLDIYRPSNASGLPVMVWIHGGAFIVGSGYTAGLGELDFNGTYLARHHNAIIVTMQYVLG